MIGVSTAVGDLLEEDAKIYIILMTPLPGRS